jgi:uncharacterized membrane protein
MSGLYDWLKIIHVLSSTVLFGTGLGTAFQMWTAHRSGDVQAISTVARHVVWADFLFTTPAVIIQPVTGVMLARLAGYDLTSAWLVAAMVLYVVTGACWLPVVWIQLKVRDLAGEAARTGAPLPAPYFRLMAWWFGLGWPAFLAVLLIFWLMIAKPTLW